MSKSNRNAAFRALNSSIESKPTTSVEEKSDQPVQASNLDTSTHSDPASRAIAMQGRARIQNLQNALKKFEVLEKEGRIEQDIAIDLIDRPNLLMRSSYYWETERFKEIKHSIQVNGLEEPITVRPSPDNPGRYLLVKGDTRLTSFSQLLTETGEERWKTIRARVQEMDDKVATLAMVLENRDRENPAAYDQGVFYNKVTESLFDGNRIEAQSFLGVSKSTMSTYIKISRIPQEIMDAFPSLFSAGTHLLRSFIDYVDAHNDRISAMLDSADELQRASPAKQVQTLELFLQNKEKAPSPKQSLETSDGTKLGEFKQGKRQTSFVINEKEMPGFSEHLKSKLDSIYDEWVLMQETGEN